MQKFSGTENIIEKSSLLIVREYLPIVDKMKWEHYIDSINNNLGDWKIICGVWCFVLLYMLLY